MKRIRRRGANRSGSSGMAIRDMRRSIGHPSNHRRHSLGVYTSIEESKPLMCENFNRSMDLEAGISTASSGLLEHRKLQQANNNNNNNNDPTESKEVSSFTRWKQQLRTLYYTVPGPIQLILLLHVFACFYSLYCIYFYLRFYAGFYTALFMTVFMAFSFAISSYTAILSFRSATLELQTVLDQEGRSRAILNTLYPERVLHQMYQELTPQQIQQAQQQQAKLRLDGSWNNQFSTTSTTHNTATTTDSSTIHLQLEDSPSNRRMTPGRTSSRRKSIGFARTHEPLTFERRPSGELDVVVVVDHNQQQQQNNNNHDNLEYEEQYGGSFDNICGEDQVFCLKRNSLNCRRQSMSRRHSQEQQTRRFSRDQHPGCATTATLRRMSMSFSKISRRTSGGSVKSVSSTASSTNKPIQERFQATTVLFADIAGFTKWCSEREPSHVFQLLESVFFAFDTLAKSLGVYKIETIGDCYVAVTGIPQPMEGHAAAMALFASQIILEFDLVVDDLAHDEEGGLGVNTANLKLRVGTHSGEVTAGVLRGDKGRFQLFGDTVNTAARMESNGVPGKVQISQEMANCLEKDGKSEWFYPRKDKIQAKGKGELNTYFLHDDLIGQLKLDKENKNASKTPKASNLHKDKINDNSKNSQDQSSRSNNSNNNNNIDISSNTKNTNSNSIPVDNPPSQSKKRQSLLKKQDEEPLKKNIREQRRQSLQYNEQSSMWLQLEQDMSATPEPRLAEWNYQQLELLVRKIMAHHLACNNGASDEWGEEPLRFEEYEGSILEELQESFETNLVPTLADPVVAVQHDGVVLPTNVVLELQAFCKALQSNFQTHPFHNFIHSCFMTRSMVQLLNHLEQQPTSTGILPKDPLAQFVIVLTCMVQDVDHPGVSNEQLMKEDAEMAEYFHNTGLTQQNALDVAWELLTGPTCENLLKAICSNSKLELERFRKYMLHSMLATDREDKDLAQKRFKRWKKVSSAGSEEGKISWDHSIAVIEQCAQLSDVIHNVQTPITFGKWNERWFREQYLAYIKGRRDDDPCENFFNLKLEMLKRTVIPLAQQFQKVSGNGLLGHCDELNIQATANLVRWTTSGAEEVRRMASDAKYEFGEKPLDGSTLLSGETTPGETTPGETTPRGSPSPSIPGSPSPPPSP